ncbi:MAG: hypothetical protein M3266_09225, partial [Actinomycetota bacterium]|nr:hypothetical protein [Actinomycetota bacterium]
MQYTTLEFEVRDGVAYITLNRPDKSNVLECPSYLSSLFRDEKEGRGCCPGPPWGFLEGVFGA